MIYIASPFFDDSSREWVTIKEENFDGTKTDYYSPRQDGLNFNAVTDPTLRAERIKLIFDNNIKHLDECNNIHVNLSPCNGHLDIGTLWELGYWIAIHGDPKFNAINDNSLTVDPNYRDTVLAWCKNLSSLNGTVMGYDVDDKYKLIHSLNEDPNRIKLTIKLNNLPYIPASVRSDLSNINDGRIIPLSNPVVVLTDDLPNHMFILLGYLYGIKFNYITTSFRDYGSNLMIAASSLGHIKINGVLDDRFRNNLK